MLILTVEDPIKFRSLFKVKTLVLAFRFQGLGIRHSPEVKIRIT